MRRIGMLKSISFLRQQGLQIICSAKNYQFAQALHPERVRLYMKFQPLASFFYHYFLVNTIFIGNRQNMPQPSYLLRTEISLASPDSTMLTVGSWLMKKKIGKKP
jgi:hypothetical protein